MRKNWLNTALLLPLVIVLAACNGSARHIATVTVLSAHASLAAVQDTAKADMCGAPTAPPEPACLTADQHRAVARQLVDGFTVDEQLQRAVLNWPAGTPQPAEIPGYLTQITGIIRDVVTALPDSGLKTKLLTTLGGK